MTRQKPFVVCGLKWRHIAVPTVCNFYEQYLSGKLELQHYHDGWLCLGPQHICAGGKTPRAAVLSALKRTVTQARRAEKRARAECKAASVALANAELHLKRARG